MVGTKYAEPYAGGAGLALRLLFEGYADHIYINDLDPSIFAFWNTIVTEADDFCRWIESVDVSVKSWKKYRAIQEKPRNAGQYELAQSTFFLNRTNISGVLQGGVIGGLNQTGKYKIDARFNKADLVRRIMSISDIKSRITVSNDDGIRFVKQLDSKHERIFIYLDPPYFKKGADLYMNYFSEKDHLALSKVVHELKNMWLVSYDNHEFIVNLYESKRMLTHRLSQSASNRVGDEILVFSDSVDFNNSMTNLKSPGLLTQENA